MEICIGIWITIVIIGLLVPDQSQNRKDRSSHESWGSGWSDSWGSGDYGDSGVGWDGGGDCGGGDGGGGGCDDGGE